MKDSDFTNHDHDHPTKDGHDYIVIEQIMPKISEKEYYSGYGGDGFVGYGCGIGGTSYSEDGCGAGIGSGFGNKEYEGYAAGDRSEYGHGYCGMNYGDGNGYGNLYEEGHGYGSGHG